MDLLDKLKRVRLPFADLLGVELISATPERVVARMRVRSELCTSPAVLHGGALMAFADSLGALGTVANLSQGAGTTTIESKTNFVRPALLDSVITGEASLVHGGRRTMVWQTRITSEDGKLLGLVTQTQMVL